ncbi:hypothetical protein FOZ63_010966 [Perkinsus olseni]|uniref:inosine/xanthosine triphosphatase n=1 Tax=Perkinsus olseni TaxID=32597 RepID=A0A7J6T287_PEROL|nr:hypothetical protein FOZ63_010966 [Perkinsus olseni]
MSKEVVRVLVASTNPVKIEAARMGIEPFIKGRELVVSGEATDSGVADQPYGDAETLRGARNRLAALCRGTKQAEFYVAFEGGVFKTEDGRLHVAAWVCVSMHGDDYVSEARTATFQARAYKHHNEVTLPTTIGKEADM